MSNKDQHHEAELPDEAAEIMNTLLANADAWGLAPDPAWIMHVALGMLVTMVENDLVMVPRAAVEAAGLTGTRPTELH